MATDTSSSVISELGEILTSTEIFVRNALPKITPQQISQLQSQVQNLRDAVNLYNISFEIHKSLSKVRDAWIPKGAIEDIIKAARCGKYADTDSEAIFLKYGNINGLVALYLGSRDSVALMTEVSTLSQEHKQCLAQHFSSAKISSATSNWIRDYDQTLKFDGGSLPRLARTFRKHKPSLSPSPSTSLPFKRSLLQVQDSQPSTNVRVIAPKPSPDSQNLLVLLGYLHSSAIPRILLLNFTRKQDIFDLDGKIISQDRPHILPVFQDSSKLELALQELEDLGLISIHLSSKDITLLPKSREFRSEISGKIDRSMRIKAILLVSYSFPLDPELDQTRYSKEISSFGADCRSQIPHLKHVLGYPELSDPSKHLFSNQLIQIVRTCLSSSFFGTFEWKMGVLFIAENILGDCPPDAYFSTLLQFRRTVLWRLNQSQARVTYTNEHATELPRTNASYNALLGEGIIFHSKVKIYENDLPQAWATLERFQSLDPSLPSIEERRVVQKIVLLRARISRFSGNFSKALEMLNALQGSGLCISVKAEFTSEYTASLSEMGEYQLALDYLPEGSYADDCWLTVHGKRISLSAAGIYLSQAIHELIKGRDNEAKSPLSQAKQIYLALDQALQGNLDSSLTTSIRYLSILFGKTIITHVESRNGPLEILQQPINSWNLLARKTTELSKNIIGNKNPSEGFHHALIYLALQDLRGQQLRREGTHPSLDDHRNLNKAKILLGQEGRHFNFIGLGSIWLDLLMIWNKGDKSSSSARGYVLQQNETGFPYTLGSKRLGFI